MERTSAAAHQAQERDERTLRRHLDEPLGRAADAEGRGARERARGLDAEARDRAERTARSWARGAAAGMAARSLPPPCSTVRDGSRHTVCAGSGSRLVLRYGCSILRPRRRRRSRWQTRSPRRLRRSKRASPRSSGSSARAPSCGSAQRETLAIEFIPTGSLAVDYAIGIGGFPRGRVVEIFGPESSGKTTLALSVIAPGAEARRHGGVHRRRARPRRRVRAQARRRHRQPAGLAARQRRAGARDRRDAGALERGRRRGHRLGGGAGAARRARGRDGRLARRPAGAAHVAGAAQAHRDRRQVEDLR